MKLLAFLSILLILVVPVAFAPTASANHSNFIVNQETGRYVQGDRIWTNVTIFAGIPRPDQVDSENKTRFVVMYTDTLLDYEGIVRIHNETKLVGSEDNETAEYERRFIQGTWNLKVQVFEEGSTGTPLEPWTEPIIVVPQAVLTADRQTRLLENLTGLFEQSLRASPIIAGLSAAVGA